MKNLKDVLEGLFDNDTDSNIDPFQSLINQFPKMYKRGVSIPAHRFERIALAEKLSKIVTSSSREIQIDHVLDVGKYKYICQVCKFSQIYEFEFYSVEDRVMFILGKRAKGVKTQGYLDATSIFDEENYGSDSHKFYEIPKEWFIEAAQMIKTLIK